MEDGNIEEILESVRVFSVVTIGNSVLVDIYGGERSVISTVCYRGVPDTEIPLLYRTFQSWEAQETALTYVRFESGVVRLVAEHEET